MKKNRGFTLIEMLVSIGLFTIAITIALGALLALSEANRKAQSLNSSINNLSFAIDSMSRTIRTALNYHCGSTGTVQLAQDCASTPQPYIAVQVMDGSLAGCVKDVPCTVTYCLSNASGNSCGNSTTCPAGSRCTLLRSIEGSQLLPVTSTEVNIEALKFYVLGATLSDNLQPKATMLIVGSVPVSESQTSPFAIQTSITQRFYDR